MSDYDFKPADLWDVTELRSMRVDYRTGIYHNLLTKATVLGCRPNLTYAATATELILVLQAAILRHESNRRAKEIVLGSLTRLIDAQGV